MVECSQQHQSLGLGIPERDALRGVAGRRGKEGGGEERKESQTPGKFQITYQTGFFL